VESIRKYKNAMTDEGENTPMRPLMVGDYLTHLEPFEVSISDTYRDEDGEYIAFRGIGRRAYMLIQGDYIQVFWTVAGNGTYLQSLDSLQDVDSFFALVLLKSVVKSIGRAQRDEYAKLQVVQVPA